MSKVAVCPKCKSIQIKVITPYPSDKLTFICEDCKFQKVLKNIQMAKRLNDVEKIYIHCLSWMFIHQQREIPLEEIEKFKGEVYSDIMEEEA
jgi:transposase-like protein